MYNQGIPSAGQALIQPGPCSNGLLVPLHCTLYPVPSTEQALLQLRSCNGRSQTIPSRHADCAVWPLHHPTHCTTLPTAPLTLPRTLPRTHPTSHPPTHARTSRALLARITVLALNQLCTSPSAWPRVEPGTPVRSKVAICAASSLKDDLTIPWRASETGLYPALSASSLDRVVLAGSSEAEAPVRSVPAGKACTP
jgi:hypothetical protein